MTQLVRRRRQPNHPSPLPSPPPPTPGGDHEPLSLFRRPDVILLPDGRRISIYQDRHGVLVTDAIRGSTRPVEDVYMEVLYDLQTRSRYPPARRRLRHLGDDAHQLCILPDYRIIHAYLDSHGVLFTEDMDGSTRSVEHVCREVISDLQTRRRGPPPPMSKPVRRHLLDFDPHKPVLLLCLLPNDRIIRAYNDSYGVLVTKDMGGFTLPVRHVFREVLSDHWTRPRYTPRPVVDAAMENQPAPQQTATPSPGPLGDDPLNRHCVANKMKLAQRCEDREQNVLAFKELLGTTTPEESSITNTSSLLQPTPHEDREPNVLASKELADTTLGKSSIVDASSTRAEAVTHSPTPPISGRKPAGWNHQFFIRVDFWGLHHLYPKLDEPFKSLELAEKAILRHLDKLRAPEMCSNDGLSRSQIAIRDALHWPDGTRRYSFQSNPDEDHMGLLVQALLDKYNEANNLFGDEAYHVEDVVRFQEVYEGDRDGRTYYHLNCTRKTKGGVDNLFFAEVLRTIREKLDEFELTCLHMVKPAVDNGPCYGCKEDNVGMKHPIDTRKYKGGHNPLPTCCGVSPPEDMDAILKTWEERIINEYKKLDVVKSDAGRPAAADGLDKSQLGRRGFPAADARMNEERIRHRNQVMVARGSWMRRDRDVAKSDAGRTAAGLEGMRYRDVAKSDAGRTAAGLEGMRYRDVAKSDAGRTAAGLEGMRRKYVVPARRQLV